MADLMKQIEEEYAKRNIPDFAPGDTVRVGVRITEGSGNDQRTRVQPYEGVVIARSGGGLNETFTVRRVTHGIGVERTFPLHSPVVAEIVVVRRGDPRRAKLYYLRKRVGRGARVREDVGGRRQRLADQGAALAAEAQALEAAQVEQAAQAEEATQPQQPEAAQQQPAQDETAAAEQ